MSRTVWIRSLIALSIAVAALLLIRLHNATGAAAEQDSISNGRRLAEAWCKKCHSLEAASAGTPGRAPDFVRIANRVSTTGMSLKAFLHSNHRNMPDLMIAPDQADDLTQFILSLRRD